MSSGSKKKIRVLVVDDSALVREILSRGLSKDPMLEVVGTAGDPYEARDKIVHLDPQVLTLDVEMPRMEGVECLRKLMPQHPLPVVMVSALTERGKRITLDALEAGAVDFVTKPKADVARGLENMILELQTKVKLASSANVSQYKHVAQSRSAVGALVGQALAESTDKVIAIGASAGGTEALKVVLQPLPANTPGIVVVQHMPAGFTKMFAQRLNSLCQMEVKEAQDGDRVMTGQVLIAPGGFQLRVLRSGGIYRVSCQPGELVCGHCPSVETMMQSVAESVGRNAVGVILTGMGHDGADGLKAMYEAGASTVAQDEKSCVVFGMPKVAIERGGVDRVLPLEVISDAILDLVSKPNKKPEAA